MKKLLISLVLVFSFSTVVTSFMPATTVVVEAKEKKKKKKIFDKGWKTFKKKWKNRMDIYEPKLKTLKAKKTVGEDGSTRYDTLLAQGVIVSAATLPNSKKIGYSSVVGLTDKGSGDQRYNTELASGVLVLITDSTIPLEKRKRIMFDKLHIGEDHKQGDEYVYTYNGVVYSLEYDEGITTVSTHPTTDPREE